MKEELEKLIREHIDFQYNSSTGKIDVQDKDLVLYLEEFIEGRFDQAVRNKYDEDKDEHGSIRQQAKRLWESGYDEVDDDEVRTPNEVGLSHFTDGYYRGVFDTFFAITGLELD